MIVGGGFTNAYFLKTCVCIIYIGEKEFTSNRNSLKSERIENAPLAIFISTEQF